jgi:hypothetical protein
LTAAELAAVAVGPQAKAAWLDRLLSAAAAMGMLKRSRVSASTIHAHAAARAAGSRVANSENEPASGQQKTLLLTEFQSSSAGPGLVFEYSLNALSAALTSASPVNMSALVAHCGEQCLTVARLSEVSAEG